MTAIPIARTGPSQWVDCRSAKRSEHPPAITVPPEAAIAGMLSRNASGNAASGLLRPRAPPVAVYEQGVIGPGAETSTKSRSVALGG